MIFLSSRYNNYSEHLKTLYGEKVYKIPISIPATCPNRDGFLGVNGCSFCGDQGAGYQHVPLHVSIKQQIKEHKKHIALKYKAKKFIAYFPNYSTTYLPLPVLMEYLEAACEEDIVRLALATRPDCLNEEYIKALATLKEKRSIDIALELGLQTVNYHVLGTVNRGHTLAEYLGAMLLLNKYGLISCTHVILNLPRTDLNDVIETAKIISIMGSKEVKIHALYIVKGTKMASEFLNNNLTIGSKEEYVERVITFLQYLDSKISVQRLIGRAPISHTEFRNWNEKWWEIRNEIEKAMDEGDCFQGAKCDYLTGKALNKFAIY